MERLSRRHWLAAAAALALGGRGRFATAAGPAPAADMLATAWDDAQGGHHIGLLKIGSDAARIVASVEVPTRAHGLLSLPDGSVLAAARRPGDWLLRWRPRLGVSAAERQDQRWVWAAEDRRFNGHLLAAADGRTLYSTETDLVSGQGLLVRRDAATLEEAAGWPTLGADPHDMEWLADGRLLVANGGIHSSPEAGRAKLDLQHMDSSLVAIDPRSGAVSGQWRLADRWLGMRHLARHPGGLVGVALQAEHGDAAERERAPVLAIFDSLRGELTSVANDRPGAAYAGDIAAMPEGWAVSCPRDHDLLLVDKGKGMALHRRLDSVCALAAAPVGGAAWALGAACVSSVAPGAAAMPLPAGHRFDNHAVTWAGPAAPSN